jgi:molybdopterin-guanine dinucleotide biosynthesis protein A
MAERCTGVILAGGGATRYGGAAKGLERVGGVRVIDRVALALASVTDELLLIANDPLAESWLPGVRVASDVRRDCGSLGGIHAALVRAGSSVMVVAWDMPFVTAELLGAVTRLGAGYNIAIPESGSKREVEPLCAWYDQACVAPIESALDAGERRVISFFPKVRVAMMPLKEVAQYGDPARLFMNVNSPAELELAERYASSPDTGDRRHEEAR